jgi:hypothetical protein
MTPKRLIDWKSENGVEKNFTRALAKPEVAKSSSLLGGLFR